MGEGGRDRRLGEGGRDRRLGEGGRREGSEIGRAGESETRDVEREREKELCLREKRSV